MELISSTADSIFRPIGLTTPMSQGAAAGAGVFGVLYYMKPAMFFRANGQMKPFKLISKDADATYFNAAVVAALAGVVIYMV